MGSPRDYGCFPEAHCRAHSLAHPRTTFAPHPRRGRLCDYRRNDRNGRHGSLDTSALRSLLERLPSGTWELVTHPGYNDASLAQVRTRLRASRDVERQLLPAIREFPAIQLASFADLRAPAA